MPSTATIFTHWKSSAQGILALIVATCRVLQTSGDLSAEWSKWVTLAGALAFCYIALISKDSGVVVAQVGTAEPKAVPSTEVPLDPKAKVVKDV